MILNPDLPSSVWLPGVYVYLDLTGQSGNTDTKRVMLLGYKTSAGTGSAAIPFQVLSEADIIDKCGTGSGVHRMARQYLDRAGNSGAELWVCPLSSPSGTAQTKFINIIQRPAAGVLQITGTGAASAGFVSWWIDGIPGQTIIANGDTYATIMQNMVSDIQAAQDFMRCTATYSGGQVLLTARTANLANADFSVRVEFSSNAMDLAASAGTLTVSGASSGAGTLTLYAYRKSVSVSVANLDTAVASGSALLAAVNAANNFPLYVAQPSVATGVLTLMYQPEHAVNWIGAEITSTITQTIAGAFGTAGVGVPSSSSPTLATALDNIAKVGEFWMWGTEFGGQGAVISGGSLTQLGSVTDYTAIATIHSHLVNKNGGGMGQNQGQIVLYGSNVALASAGANVTSPSPALTTSPLATEVWSPSNPMACADLAAARLGMLAKYQDYPDQNDAGYPMTGSGRVEWMLPHIADNPSDLDTNAAMKSYHLTPCRIVDGQIVVVAGITTAKPGANIDISYVYQGVILTDQEVRRLLIADGAKFMKGKNIKIFSPANTSFAVDLDGLRQIFAARMFALDSADLFDGAEGAVAALEVKPNANNPARVDVKFPKRYPLPLLQISVVTQRV